MPFSMCSNSIKLICGCCFALAFLTSLVLVPSQTQLVKEVEEENSDDEDTVGASTTSGYDGHSSTRRSTQKRVYHKTNYTGYLQIMMIVLMIVSGCIYVYHSEVGSHASMKGSLGDASGIGGVGAGVVQNVHLSKQNVQYTPTHSNNQTETFGFQETIQDGSTTYAPPPSRSLPFYRR